MATVYLARDLKHDRPVALKVLHPELAATLGPERFRREITIAAKLQHPHILSVHDSGETPTGQLWFTMMYVEGESLRDRLRREHQLPVEETIRITRETALALHYAHEHGIVHRDIKPENVLLTTDGSTLVADFGIARALDASSGDGGQELTLTGMVVGTPQYMSPEQAAGERDVGPRSDAYSLAAVTYEMLAGEPPFTGPTPQAVVAKIMSGQPPSVRRMRPSVAEGVDAVIRKALASVPADRFAEALDFARALEAAERSAMTAGASSTSGGRRAHRVPRGAALLGLGFFVGVGVLFGWRRHETGAPAGGGPVGLAVLPFDNEGDTANAYFADGITDEIRSKLSALPALRLIASGSSNQYRHTGKPADQIGQELGVRYLLTGRVQWEHGSNGTLRVRVSPELVEVRDGAVSETKWQQSYDTTLADVFDVQAAVASRVADKLGVVLSSPAQTQLAGRPTQNLAAYDAYLRSTALVGDDPPTNRRALAAAEQAVALDSGFAEAWAHVSVLHALLYINSTPTQADADAARRSAERAVALAPAAPEGYSARGFYNYVVTHDLAAARAAYETALRLAPSSSDAIRRLAEVEAAAGQWAPALAHDRQSAALDPRSSDAAARVSQLLLWLRRYPEARAEAVRGLTLAPGDLSLIQDRALSRLGEGDLAGARAGLRDVPPTLDRGAIAAYMANYWDMYWALDSTDRALVLTLGPAAFDNDRGTWGIVHAQLYWLAGDTGRARRSADSARAEYEAQLRATPDDFQRHLFRGLVLAYLGQRAAAVREGTRGLTLAQATGDVYSNLPYTRHLLARLYLAIGEHGKALDQLDSLLANPYFVSPKWLAIDPTWAPLKGEARFQQLIATTATSPAP